jgi:hypothetical protein
LHIFHRFRVTFNVRGVCNFSKQWRRNQETSLSAINS